MTTITTTKKMVKNNKKKDDDDEDSDANVGIRWGDIEIDLDVPLIRVYII